MSDPRRPSWATMREDRPLDALFPELAAELPPVQAAPDGPPSPPVFWRVLEVELEDTWQWALASFAAPQDAHALLASLSPLIEATLLQELSRPPGYGGLESRAFEGAVLFAFEAFPPSWTPTLEAAGLTPLDRYEPDHYRARMTAWQREAAEAGLACPDRPAQIWWMPLHRPDPALARALKIIQVRTAEALGSRVWGHSPGLPSKIMAQHVQAQLSTVISPTLQGLHELDMLMVERVHGRVRWLDPMLFQGLCDLIGVLAIHELRQRVQWGMCQPDGQGGVLPPLLRLDRAQGPHDLEIGLELYRAIIAPLPAGQDAPLLRDWASRLLRAP